MDKDKKKGILERLIGSKKDNKNSCCGGFRIEEIPEEDVKIKVIKDSPAAKK